MLKEGTVVGQRYEIISRVGGGGMADVYKAKDHKLNRMVAVKVMKAEFKEDPTFITKFRKEAQAAAGLSHPNIVNVYDVGDDNGLYYIVMELVEGITLKDYIVRKGKLSVKEATSIAIQVSLGLQAAHNRGIIHRDVKPQNIIISVDGKVKLSDFGIAKATNSNTITSNVMGSVHYSSPEQVRGGFSNAKSDIYSLGVTLYEMVTGRVPFDGETTVSIAIKHLQEEIEPPTKYTPNLPYSLEQIILKCTQKSPDRRYNDMAELIADLKHSLMDPQGNFVALAPLAAHAQTVMMSPDEMENIRNTQMRDENTSQQGYAGMDSEEDEDEDEEDDYDYEDDEEDDEDEESSKLEKAITIASFVIGAIVIIILIVFIARAAGLFGGKEKTKDNSNSTSISSSAEEETKVTVPDLTNKTQDEAIKLLNTLGLGGHYSGEENSDTIEEGKICWQEIAANEKVDKNTQINFKVSSGKGSVTIPEDIVNISQQNATVKLSELGLSVAGNVEKQSSDSVAIGNVITTDPAPGTSVSAGSEVTLTISTGPEQKPDTGDEEQVKIPSYIGLTLEDAQASLEAKGIEVEVEYGSSSAYDTGDVIKQSVAGNSSVPKGSTIVLTVNDPSKAASNNPATATGKWYSTSPLQKPKNYDGGLVTLVLEQIVSGETRQTTVYSGTPWENGDFTTPVEGADGVSTGKIYVYADGSDSPTYVYSSVPFAES